MKPSATVIDNRWSQRKIWILCAWLFAGHVGLLFLFGRPAPDTVREPVARTSFRMIAGRIPSGALDALFVSDPTLFVLPGRDSFSGTAWMKMKDSGYSPAEWTEPPQWLQPRTDRFVNTFQGVVQSNRTELSRISEKVGPYEAAPTLPNRALTNGSVVKVDGAIASRLVSPVPGMMAWQHGEPLDRTIVQIAVSPAGQVLNLQVINRSGLGAADEAALKLAGSLQFAPISSNEPALMRGRVSILWQTEPLPATNVTLQSGETR